MLNSEILFMPRSNWTAFILIHPSSFADALKILDVIRENLGAKRYYLGYWFAQKLTTVLGYRVTSRDGRFS